MNTLVLPKDVIHLKYKNQNQHTQKKLLDFLVTKNISFYEANPRNFEAIVQIYNINSNKPKSLSKSPSAHPNNTSKSPLKSSKKKIAETPQKITTSSPNLNSSKKKQKNLENDQKKQETLKKRNPSSNDSSKTKAKGNIFLEELQKNIGNQGNSNKERKLTRESMKNKENMKKISTEEEIKSSRLSQQNLTPENSKKTKKSLKNESSMRILQKNKQILDNMINAHSVLEFEANKHQNTTGSNHERNKENMGDPSISHESQENDQNAISREKKSNSVSKSQKKMKNSQKGSFLKGEKGKMSVSQEKTKENTQNRKISEKMESNFKEIVKKEFSRVPSGEKLNKNSINLQFQKAVQILYERLDLLSSEELIFYYKFIVSKAKKLYLDFLQKRGLIVN